MAEAAEALGWEFEAEVFKSAEPEKALQQAISRKPDFIGITGIPASLLKPQLAAAEKAGIPVLSCGAATPEKPGEQYAADCGHTDVLDAENAAAWIADESEGKGHILGVTIPQYPILNTQTEYFESPAFEEACPECTYEELDATPEEVGAGTLPNKVSGYLQAHSEIDYLYLTFNDLSIGLYPVLQSAGLAEKVKITGGAATNSVIKEIPDQMAAWTVEPVEYSSWVMADGMARIATGEEITPAYRKLIQANPSWLVDSKESVETLKDTNYEWPGPEDFQGQFKALWKVGS
jgi:ribose transport system substrate-binding protein